jgi:hypothetical protein
MEGIAEAILTHRILLSKFEAVYANRDLVV